MQSGSPFAQELLDGSDLVGFEKAKIRVSFPLFFELSAPREEHETKEKTALITLEALTDLILEVKGETIEASASERATPVCAVRSAPQSFPPSPHMPTTTPDAIKASITRIC